VISGSAIAIPTIVPSSARFGQSKTSVSQCAASDRLPQLRAAILAYVDAHNDRGTPFKWVKTADEILDSMRRFGPRLQQVRGQ